MEPEMIKIKINGMWYAAVPLDVNNNTKEVEQLKNPYSHRTEEYYINLLANKFNTDNVKGIKSFLIDVKYISKGAFLSMLLYVIAVDLDKDYSDNIRNLENVWVYNKADGRFAYVSTKDFSKNAYDYIAMFRNKEDAVFAIKTANAIKKYLYAE